MEIIGSLFTFGFNIISFFFVAVIALVAGITAWMKGRNGYLWGGITLFMPWMIFFVFMLPVKAPKLKSYLKDEPGFKDKNPVIASLMALSAIVAKADGHVSQGEVDLIRRFITVNFRISSQELATYQPAFDYGKDHPEEYKEFVRIIKTYYSNRNFILSVSYLLMTIGMKDDELSVNEESFIKKIIIGLGLSEYEYTSIKQFFKNGFSGARYAGGFGQGFGGFQSGFGYNRGQGQQSYGFATGSNMADEYAEILGVSKDDDLATIKKAYRKLAKEYHPDKMAADGMPEDYMKFANEKIAKINEAYDYFKKVKEENSTGQYV